MRVNQNDFSARGESASARLPARQPGLLCGCFLTLLAQLLENYLLLAIMYSTVSQLTHSFFKHI